jgi:hypothetical protein
MNKQTKNVKKIKKFKKNKKVKGGLFTSLGKEGSFIPENIKYEVKMGHDNSLLDEYKIRKENANKEYDVIFAKYKQEQDEIDNQDKKNNLSRLYWLKVETFIFNIVKSIFSAISILLTKFYKIITSLGSGFFVSFKLGIETFINICNLGKGAIIKTIILILIILFCIGATIGFFSNPNNASKFDYNNSTNMDFYFKTNRPSFMSSFSNTLMGFVPERYQTNFTSFKNSFNKTLGNDLNANSRNKYNRENIGNKGRYDGIYHIKYDNNDKIYSTIKPGDIKWDLEINNYKNSDFFKLPSNIQAIYNTSNDTTVNIPVNVDKDTGKYSYKLDNNAYFGSNPTKKINANNFPYTDDTSSIYGNIFTLNNNTNVNIFKNNDKKFGENINNSFNISATGDSATYPIKNIYNSLGI